MAAHPPPRAGAVLPLVCALALLGAACDPYGCTYTDAILAETSGTAVLPSGDSVSFFDRAAVGGSPPTFAALQQAALQNQGEGSLHAVWRQYVPDRRTLVTMALAVPFPLVPAETLGVDSLMPAGNVVRLPDPEPGVRYPVYAWLDSGAPFLIAVSGVVVVEGVRPLQLWMDVASHADGGLRSRLTARVAFFAGRVVLVCPD